MTKIMSSLYMREIVLYDLAFKCLWSVLKSILVSGLHQVLFFISLLQLFVMHLLRFLVLVWEERKAKALYSTGLVGLAQLVNMTHGGTRIAHRRTPT